MADLGRFITEIRAQFGPGDEALGLLAGRQNGVVAHWQLVMLGFGRGAIMHRLETGGLYRLYRGVYAVGHLAIGQYGRWTAAVLTGGPEAVGSHHMAAAIWGLRKSSRSNLDVTTPDRGRAARPGIVLHRVRSLHPEDRDHRYDIPVTSVARTIFDQAEVLQRHQLANVVAEAEARRLFDLRAIERLIARSPGRRALKLLKLVLADYVDPHVTRSELERAFLRLCAAFGIPLPQTNLIVAGHRVDAVWFDQRLVVELDGRRHHLTTRAFEEDRRRDADLQLAGYRVLRITWRRLRDEPGQVAEIVARLLGLGQPAVR